jgi:hypothetical protein
VQARIYTTQMDKFTGETSRAPCPPSPSRRIIALPSPPQQATTASTKHGTKFLPMLFPRKFPAIFCNLQINHVMFLTPRQVPPPARTSIGVKELPLGRWMPARDCLVFVPALVFVPVELHCVLLFWGSLTADLQHCGDGVYHVQGGVIAGYCGCAARTHSTRVVINKKHIGRASV